MAEDMENKGKPIKRYRAYSRVPAAEMSSLPQSAHIYYYMGTVLLTRFHRLPFAHGKYCSDLDYVCIAHLLFLSIQSVKAPQRSKLFDRVTAYNITFLLSR